MMVSQYQREFLAIFGASYSSQKEILRLFKKTSKFSSTTISRVWQTVALKLDEETFNELCVLIETGDNYYVESYKFNRVYKRHEEDSLCLEKARERFEAWSNRILKIYSSLKGKNGRKRNHAFNLWLKENQQYIIENHSILTVSEIAETLGVKPPMISHARRKLYEKGLIFQRDRVIPKKERSLLQKQKRRERDRIKRLMNPKGLNPKILKEQLEYEYQQIMKIVIQKVNKNEE